MITASTDGNGNTLIFNSRGGIVSDIAMMTAENVQTGTFGSCYLVKNSTQHTQETGAFGSIGNKIFAIGDGSAEAIYVSAGPPATEVAANPDQQIYSFEWSEFPKSKFYVQGPNKTIFAAGCPDEPLTIYVSEAGGASNKLVDAP